MSAKVINWNDVEEAVKALRKGEVVAFPTETVYGLAVIANQKKAFEKLVAIKRRSPDKPFTLMCASLGQAAQYVQTDVHSACALKKFLPGELTAVLTARPGIPDWISLGTPFIGVRIPDAPEVRALIEKVGAPLLVPSANRSGEKPLTSFEDVRKEFDKDIAVIIEGACRGGQPSTVVKMPLNGPAELLREGPIPFQAIDETHHLGRVTVSIACDHGAYDLKNHICKYLDDRGYIVWDEGTFSKDSCDYPIFAKKAADQVASGRANFGIVCCTSGEGVCIVANKVRGIRCGMGYNDEVTAKCREHNDANMIAFGAKYMAEEDVLRRVDIFLLEKLSSAGRHQTRVNLINQIN